MRTTLAILVFSIGCSGGDGDGVLGGDVVGRWRIIPNATDENPEPVDQRQVLEFAADGTLTETESDRVTTGTYTIDGGNLSITEDGETAALVIPYAATGDRFVFGALVPAGSVDGVVGTWTGTIVTNESTVLTIDLAADASAHLAYDHSSSMDEAYDGTWLTIGDDLEVTFVPQDNFTVDIHATLVAGALGTPYERL